MKTWRLEIVWGCAVLALSLASTLASAAQTPQMRKEPVAANRQAVLVELFTSEGCSSCPPADELLRKIDGKRTGDGTLIVGISEHVNYWDHGGWKDSFDSEAITNRQNQYGERFHLDSVYTPQMVIDGKTQFVGSDAKAFVQAIGSVPPQSVTVKILSATLEGKGVAMVVSLAGDLAKRGAEMFAVVAQDETTAHVAAGENQGRTLVHASVARTYGKVATVRAAGETTLRIALPDDLKTTPESRRHLIVWAQEPNLGPVLGVDAAPF